MHLVVQNKFLGKTKIIVKYYKIKNYRMQTKNSLIAFSAISNGGIRQPVVCNAFRSIFSRLIILLFFDIFIICLKIFDQTRK